MNPVTIIIDPDFNERIMLGVLRSVYTVNPALARRMLGTAQRHAYMARRAA